MKKGESILAVKDLAQIRSGAVAFGDFTLLVGPQASGKSIFLQLLKLIIDRHHISNTLRINGFDWGGRAENLLELFFGESMSGIWRAETEVKFEGKSYTPASFLPKQGVGEAAKEERLFYIPAQRVVTMYQGWPRSFGAFDIGDPYVLKSFSETVRVLMEKESSNGKGHPGKVFPTSGRIKEPLRKALDESIFYGATIEMDRSSLKKRFLLQVGGSKLPFMNWSAGQKEFMPLLLSLYHLIPSSKVSTKGNIQWVVIEEPEMGLHPRAIQSVLLVCLELIERGYKVVVSTHSPVLIELAWAMNYIQAYGGTADSLFELFSIPKSTGLKKDFNHVIANKTFRTYYFQRQDAGVQIKDISSLDAGSEDIAIANWGGLSEFAGKAADVVSKLASHEEK